MKGPVEALLLSLLENSRTLVNVLYELILDEAMLYSLKMLGSKNLGVLSLALITAEAVVS